MKTCKFLVLVAALMVLGLRESLPETTARTDQKVAPAGRTDLHGDPLPQGTLARLGSVRFRHGSNVFFIAFLPDGKLLTAGQEGTARLWEVATGREIRHFDLPRPTENVVIRMPYLVPLAVSADGKTLAASDGWEVVRLWDVATGKERDLIKKPKHGVRALALTADGKTVAATSADGTTTLWNTANGEEIRQFHSYGQPPEPDEALDGRRPAGGFGGIGFSPDGKRLVTLTDEPDARSANCHVLRLWDPATGNELAVIRWPNGHAGDYSFAFSPDSTRLAWAGLDGNLHLEDVNTGKPIRYLKGNPYSQFAFAPDGKTLLGAAPRAIHRWEADTGKELASIPKPDSRPNYTSASSSAFAVSPDGKLFAWSEGYVVRLMDQAGKELPSGGGHDAAVRLVRFSADGKTLTSQGDDMSLRTWEAATGKQTTVQTGLNVRFLSPDGKLLASLSSRNGPVIVAEVATGKTIQKLVISDRAAGGAAGPPAAFSSVTSAQLAFTPDSAGLAVCDSSTRGSTVRIFDIATGNELRSFGQQSPPAGRLPPGKGGPGGGPGGFASRSAQTPAPVFSPSGKLLVLSLTNKATVYEIATGRQLCQLTAEKSQRLAEVAISPDDRTVVLDGGDGLLTLFEVATGKERARLGNQVAVPPPPFPLRSSTAVRASRLDFSPNGKLLLRADGASVRLWDVAAGQEVGELEGHSNDILTLTFSPNGQTLATGSLDATVLIWDAALLGAKLKPPAELPAEAVPERWAALAGDDGTKAFAAINDLAGAPKQALPFLKERLKPVSLDAKQIEKLIADLNSDNFATREQATEELKKLGSLVESVLRKALEGDLPPEARRRVNALLEEMPTEKVLSAEDLRGVRGVEVLERLGTVEAKELLKTLAGGLPTAPTTVAAKAALERARR